MEQTLHYLQALKRRASGHTKQIEQLSTMYNNFSAGLIGEKRVIFSLKELAIPHIFIHNYTTFNEVKHPVQIDIIFICHHFVFVLEVKNITGKIDFDESRRQFIRKTIDGRVESFMSPVDQVLRHRQFIESLTLNCSLSIPVEAAVVIANHNAIIGNISSEIPIFNVAGTRHIITELCKKYRHIQYDINKIRQLIMSRYIKRDIVIPIPDLEIADGILCNTCHNLMQHVSKGFKCIRCNSYDINNQSLLQSLWEYKLIYSDTITNRAFRNFAKVSSPTTSKYILNRLKLPMIGSNRGAHYSLSHLNKILK